MIPNSSTKTCPIFPSQTAILLLLIILVYKYTHTHIVKLTRTSCCLSQVILQVSVGSLLVCLVARWNGPTGRWTGRTSAARHGLWVGRFRDGIAEALVASVDWASILIIIHSGLVRRKVIKYNYDIKSERESNVQETWKICFLTVQNTVHLGRNLAINYCVSLIFV